MSTCGHLLCALSDTCGLSASSIGRPVTVVSSLETEATPRDPIPTSLEGMTHAQALELRHALRARLAYERLYDFVRQAWSVLEPGTRYEDAWYVKAICDHVQRQLEDWAALRRTGVGAQPMQNLRINIPPRMLKSRIVNVCGSAWAWLHWPDMKIMSLSANPRVSDDCARDVLNLIRSAWYVETFRPAWKVTNDALSQIILSSGGRRAARGLESQITGEGADWQIIDDPHDAKEVYSEARRLAVTDGYTRAVYNRVSDQRISIRTCIMQRLHEGDFSGTCAKLWPCLILPMEYVPQLAAPTVIGWRDPRRAPGEILHPGRFSRSFLDAEKVRLGAFGYAGQMQQSPAPLDGGIFQLSDFGKYDETDPPKCESYTISVDAAFKKTANGSRVSIQLWGRRGGSRFLIDNDTRPMDYVETKAAIKGMRAKWQALGVRTTKVLIEDKANGSAIINELRTQWADVVESSPGSDSKEGRAMSVQPQVQAKSVYLPVSAPWLDDFKHEIAVFPNGAHDDQVDAMVQCLIDMKLSNDAARAAMLNTR